MAISTIDNSGISASAAISTSKLGTGAVLQVVNATYGTQTSIATSTFTTTGLTASITPSSSTSKIFIAVSVPTNSASSGQNATITIYRNSTNLALNTNLGVLQGNGAPLYANINVVFLDSPATTSATTYTVYGQSSSGTVYFNNLGMPASSSIILMEIAG